MGNTEIRDNGKFIMRRRKFIISSPITAAFFTCGKKGTTEEEKKPCADTLAGRTPEQLREEYRYWLFDDFLPFFDRYVIDHEYGGFKCITDWDGTNLSTDKQPGWDGRGVWVYSFLYRYFTKDQKHLDVALNTAALLVKTEPGSGSLWPGRYSRNGTPVDRPDSRIYNDAFIATGFQELAKVTGDSAWWFRAKAILEKCLRFYDSTNYFPDFPSASYYLGPGAPSITGPRCLGEWMVLFWIAVQMLEFRTDADVEAVRQRCIDAVFNHHYNPKFDLINELLDFDMNLPNNEISQLVYTGHAFQILWMFMFDAVRTRDKSLFEKSLRLFKRHVEVARDDVYGGVFQCLQHVDKNIWLIDKPLWAQEEPLVGLMYSIEHIGGRWASELFGDLYSWVTDKFPLTQYGCSLWNLTADRKATFLPHASKIGRASCRERM